MLTHVEERARNNKHTRTSAQQQRGELPAQDILQTLGHPHRGHVKGAHGVARHGVSAELHHHRLGVELCAHFLHYTAETETS